MNSSDRPIRQNSSSKSISKVVLPEPVGPIMAMCWPCSNLAIMAGRSRRHGMNSAEGAEGLRADGVVRGGGLCTIALPFVHGLAAGLDGRADVMVLHGLNDRHVGDEQGAPDPDVL